MLLYQRGPRVLAWRTQSGAGSKSQLCPVGWLGSFGADNNSKNGSCQAQFIIWLVVWLPFFIFPHIGNLIIPIDELIFFRGFFQPPTSFFQKPIYPLAIKSFFLAGRSPSLQMVHAHEFWDIPAMFVATEGYTGVYILP